MLMPSNPPGLKDDSNAHLSSFKLKDGLWHDRFAMFVVAVRAFLYTTSHIPNPSIIDALRNFSKHKTQVCVSLRLFWKHSRLINLVNQLSRFDVMRSWENNFGLGRESQKNLSVPTLLRVIRWFVLLKTCPSTIAVSIVLAVCLQPAIRTCSLLTNQAANPRVVVLSVLLNCCQYSLHTFLLQ